MFQIRKFPGMAREDPDQQIALRNHRKGEASPVLLQSSDLLLHDFPKTLKLYQASWGTKGMVGYFGKTDHCSSFTPRKLCLSVMGSLGIRDMWMHLVYPVSTLYLERCHGEVEKSILAARHAAQPSSFLSCAPRPGRSLASMQHGTAPGLHAQSLSEIIGWQEYHSKGLQSFSGSR